MAVDRDRYVWYRFGHPGLINWFFDRFIKIYRNDSFLFLSLYGIFYIKLYNIYTIQIYTAYIMNCCFVIIVSAYVLSSYARG